MKGSGLYQQVPAAKLGRSVFNLSYEKKMTAEMGLLYPVMCDHVIPGDKFQIANRMVIRFMPLVAPVLHEINATVHYFFVPYRLLWDDWESFVTGGVDGDFATAQPRWLPTSSENGIGSLWDYLGFPTEVIPADCSPVDYPRRAYNKIWNEYYRDENLQDEIEEDNTDLLRRNWPKDYFASCLPWQQRGDSPSLPIAGTAHAVWSDTDLALIDSTTGFTFPYFYSGGVDPKAFFYNDGAGANARLSMKGFMNSNDIDLSVAESFSLADFRFAMQVQRWLERSARGGIRYVEFLKSFFGVSPTDDRLQRPEYIGGSKQPIIFSEVLQTSSTDSTSPQGNLAGHGISVDGTYCGSYYATEFGLIMGLLSIMPNAVYQQGVDRQWLQETKYDYYFPQFAHLSEQPVYVGELFATDTGVTNKTVFGFQGRYNEHRSKRNMICGQMRDDFSYWHLSRIFETTPELNSTFLECNPRRDIFAAPGVAPDYNPEMVISFGNIIRAIRPMPIQAVPGLIDHE